MKHVTRQFVQGSSQSNLVCIQPGLIIKKRYAGFWLRQVCKGIDVASQHSGGWVSHHSGFVELLVFELRQEGWPPAPTPIKKSF